MFTTQTISAAHPPDSGTALCSITSAVATFYILEELRLVLVDEASQLPSRQVLAQRITHAQQETAELLVRVLHDYIVLACGIEARHGLQCASRTAVYDLPIDRWGFYSYGNDREEFIPVVLTYSSTSILKQTEILFSGANWTHGYGGGKWANIARVAQQTYPNAIVHADTLVNLSHNNGTAFNKGYLFTVDDTLTAILEEKAVGSLLYPDNENSTLYVPPQVAFWADQVAPAFTADLQTLVVEDPFLVVEWGDRALRIRGVDHDAHTCPQCQGEATIHCTYCREVLYRVTCPCCPICKVTPIKRCNSCYLCTVCCTCPANSRCSICHEEVTCVCGACCVKSPGTFVIFTHKKCLKKGGAK